VGSIYNGKVNKRRVKKHNQKTENKNGVEWYIDDYLFNGSEENLRKNKKS
jgi:hypothetical protein